MEQNLPAVGAPVEPSVRPRAWALFAPNSNYRIWSTVRTEVERLAAEAGAPVEPLYDQAALDAAVAAERERWVAKAGTAYTEAHAIFNDPPSETAQEVRDVIEWHLYRMRHDEIEGPNAPLTG